MKKTTIAVLLAFVMVALLLTGCGGSAKSSGAMREDAYYDEPAYAAEAAYDYDYDYDFEDYAPAEEMGFTANSAAMAEPAPLEQAKQDGAKIIYTASLDMETTEFDVSAAKLGTLVTEMGGYFESSSVSEYSNHMRYGSYTVRVPAEHYRAFMDRAGELCRVKRSNEYTEDVSEYYYDTSGRLQTQKTKLARLQALLAAAENMEDIITLEDAISRTEENIDRLSGELRHYDAKVAYSTVTISLDEVERLSNVDAPQAGFGARMATAFSEGWQAFLDGLEVIAVIFAYTWMWLILIAAVVVLIVFLARRGKKRRMARRAARAAQKQQAAMQQPVSVQPQPVQPRPPVQPQPPVQPTPPQEEKK